MVIVAVAPKISRDMMGAGKDIKAKVGEEFKIAIPFTANPTPTASWSKVSWRAGSMLTVGNEA